MDITGTIQLIELTWTLSAVPGLVLWLANWRRAGKALAAARILTPRNGRLMWARFARRMTTFMVLIETFFLAIGLRAMTLAPNPVASEGSSNVVAALFITLSLAVTFIGRDWRRVDEYLLRAAERDQRLR